MRKKRKKKKRGVATDVKAIYQRGIQLYLEEENYVSALKYLFRAAKAGYKKAYGQIGIILYLEKNIINEAIEWFKKAEAANCLFAPAAYYFGLLLYLEKGERSKSLEYFQKAAREGYDLAYGVLGSVLYLENAEIDEAEKWFKKAEQAGCLQAPHAYDYGMLLIEERGDIERGNRYLDKAAEDEYQKF